MELLMRQRYLRELLTSSRNMCYFLAALTVVQFILFLLINHALWICTCLSWDEVVSPQFAVGAPTSYKAGWKRSTLQEILTDVSPLTSCPDKFFRNQNPSYLSNYRTSDNTEVISLLDMHKQEFLPNYNNPCWYECLPSENPYALNVYRNHDWSIFNLTFNSMNSLWEERRAKNKQWRLRCVPHIYIAGMPKCGTTDLYYKVTLHPDVITGPMKEPQWWTRTRIKAFDFQGQNIVNEINSFTDYLDLYDEAAERLRSHMSTDSVGQMPKHREMIVDGTVSTFWENLEWRNEKRNEGLDEPDVTIPHYIHHVHPEARIIVLFRNPVDRLYSSYNYFRHENTSPMDFHNQVVSQTNMMTTCLAERSLRSCVYSQDFMKYETFGLHEGMYHVFVTDWYKVFNKDQILILQTEEFKADQANTLAHVFEFIGAAPLRYEKMQMIVNSHTYKQNTMDQMDAEPMLAETRQLLQSFYQPHNQALSELLQDRKYLWEEPEVIYEEPQIMDGEDVIDVDVFEIPVPNAEQMPNVENIEFQNVETQNLEAEPANVDIESIDINQQNADIQSMDMPNFDPEAAGEPREIVADLIENTDEVIEAQVPLDNMNTEEQQVDLNQDEHFADEVNQFIEDNNEAFEDIINDSQNDVDMNSEQVNIK